ncbi:unnamed protein product [Schistosoma rodhaini]|nr:unnamed protein product [Schistosoma rodhaini]
MKFSEDSSGLPHLNSTSNKTVKEYDSQKIGKKHSSDGDVCDFVVSQKNINESKESSSDRQITFTSTGSYSNHSNVPSSSEYSQKARRSLLDWDSFINLPKKPRSLSLKTDDLSRTLAAKTTDSRSPIKSRQESNSRASPCLSPIKANDFIGNVKLAPLRVNTEQVKLLTNGSYSSSEEHHSKGVPPSGGESSDFNSFNLTLSSIPVKNRAETRKRRLSLTSASNYSEVSSNQLDIHSQRRNENQILTGNHGSKKRKLSPSVGILRKKDTFTCITKENLCNGVQSPDFAVDTGNSIHSQRATCHSLCGACNHENHISNESKLRELSGSDEFQQNHSLTKNSFAITHVATQRPSLRSKRSSKLPEEELISTQNRSNLANKSVFQCLYCTRPFSEKRYRLKHMIACQLAPKNLTKKKLHEIGRMYESSSISSGSPNLVNNVDEEISISNGVICQANQTLQNGHSEEIENTVKEDKKSLEKSYQSNPKVNHDIDLKSNPITPFLSTATNPLINSDDSLRTDCNSCTTNTFDSHLVTKLSGNNSSPNNKPYESDEDIWQNYRPSYGGPYTCSFCYRVIHNRSNFSRHIAACKARISLSTRSTPKPKHAVQGNKRKFHFVFTPTHKMTPQLKNSRKELFRSGMLNTEFNKIDKKISSPLISHHQNADNCVTSSEVQIPESSPDVIQSCHECSHCHKVFRLRKSLQWHKCNHKVDHQHSYGDTDNNETAMNSGEKSLDPHGLSTLDKNVTALANSEDSQHDCTNERLVSTECHHNNSIEDEQKKSMSPSTSELETSGGITTTTMTMTTTTTSSEQDASNENLTATVFKCDMCSLSYRHRTSLLRHARQSNHKVDLIRTRKRRDYVKNDNSGMRRSGECLNGGGCMDNEMVSNLTWKECSESMTLDSNVVENENIGEVVGEVDHQHSNGDTDNNETAMNSGEKSLDPHGLSTLDKNVTALAYSEDSQHDCTNERLVSTECHHNNSIEDEQKKSMSPSTSELETSGGITTTTTTMTTTTTTTSSEQDASNENLTATVFKCDMCSLSYRHRTSLLRHARQSNHKVDLIRTRKRRDYVKNDNSGMRRSGECLNGSGCMDNEMVSNLTWKECSESMTLDSNVVENENIGEVVGEVDHQHSNGDTDNNETAMNSGEKSLDPHGLSTLDKNVTALAYSEDSQHDCTNERLVSTECHHNNSIEDEQKKSMSPWTSELETSGGITTTTMTTTTTTTSSEQDASNENLTATVFKCDMCSLSYRHRTSLLRHARQSNHKVDLIRTRKRRDYVKNDNSGMRRSGECLNGSGCMDNEMVSNLTWKECSESMTLDSNVVENENIGEVVGEVCYAEKCCSADEVTTDSCEIRQNSVSTVDLNREVFKFDHGNSESEGKLIRDSDFKDCPSTDFIDVKQISEIHSSSNNSSILLGKTCSLGLRSRRLSVQSNQSMQNTETSSIIPKLNRRKNRSASPYSLRHPRIDEEISKCRQSSLSTQSLSDNLIDDVRSIISNATTVPASDYSSKTNESSSLFTCSWCNRSGFKCWRYLQIHRARCSSRPNRSNKQKFILSTNNISQVKTSLICQQCNREFRSEPGLKVHQTLMSHNNNKSFIHKNKLSNNLSSQSIACPGCSHNSPLFESTEKLLKHLLTLKSTNTTTTNNNNNHTNRSQYWPTVLSVPNLGYGCHICGVLLASESRLDKHKKAVHEVWLFQEQQNISPSKKLPTSTS